MTFITPLPLLWSGEAVKETTRKLKFIYRKSRVKTLFGASSISFYFKKNRNDIEIHFTYGIELNLLHFQKHDFSLEGFGTKLDDDNVRINSLLRCTFWCMIYSDNCDIYCFINYGDDYYIYCGFYYLFLSIIISYVFKLSISDMIPYLC